ncbi:lipopolysaccharide heptosyltransferase II [Humisphaera borealis]|uniref:lipopolysaccharide heptosyltransferase II n=1 Tax=Humisphaera borealis TaxID=2807512 RepID=A0A7M2WPC6_9BACT|nr:lipopolysaccharide heptosyltransferase II [Humisphaera borealis]QOV87316.1 lipopolysaccharide heptosyltransferase II [Humisphaera borealis]
MSDPAKILVVQPSWVGDAVMATPTLRSLRLRYPNAEISYLMKRYVKPLYAGMPWADRLITYRTGKTKAKAGKGQFFDLAARLRSADFDMAVLLPNSFKSALVCRMAKIKKVVGYDRDGRGFLLSDRLLAPKEAGKFVPNPIIKYYLGLAHYLGAGRGGASGDLKMELFVTPAEKREAEAVLERGGLPRDIDRPGSHGQPPMILLNPGANYGAAKLWKAEYFAELADRFIEELGATVLISAAPKERPIVEQIKRHMKRAPVDLSNKGTDLGNLKEIIRRCDLMVTNDTGPRHIAAAMDVPVVTIFGPTHPEWTEIYYPKERQVAVKVFCGPCQKKTCPLDHRCITRVTPAMVWDKSVELLKAGSASEPQTTVVAGAGS